MKKLISILTVAVLIFSLVSCAKTSTSENSPVTGGAPQTESTKNDETQDTSLADEESISDTEQVTDKKTLIVYFSWSASGNTEKMANYIKEQTGGDIYEITAQNDYPTDYKECTDVALAERDNNERPAIKDLPDSIEEYDTILIGYPIWWGEAPRIINTFVESYSFSGKTIVPFCTSGGSGIGSSAKNLEGLTSGAEWLSGTRLSGNASKEDVTEWIDGLGLDINSK